MPPLSSSRTAWCVACTLGIAPTPGLVGQPPRPAPPKSFTLPAKHDVTLPNGMRLTFVPYGAVPLATVSLIIRTGAIDESADQVWLSKLMGDYWLQGTGTRSAAQLANVAAGMGGAITVNAQDDAMSLDGTVLGDSAAAFVGLIGDLAQHPKFPDSELKRLVGDRVRQIAIDRTRPQTLASQRYAPLMYPDHPYGRTMPTVTALQGYTTAAVRDFFAKNVGAARAHLYIVGKFDPDRAERAARAAFADWAAGRAPTINVPTTRAGRTLVIVDRPHAVQSTIRMGLRVPEPNNADWIALNVTDALLGGMFSSRIVTNLRERKGYSYSPFSIVNPHEHTAAWTEFADVTTNVTGPSLQVIVDEINRLRKDPPSADELKGGQSYLAGSYVLSTAIPAGLIFQLSFADNQDLGDAYLSSYVQRVYAVTAADVQTMAQRYLDPAQMAIVVAGDSSRIATQLAPFRPIVQ